MAILVIFFQMMVEVHGKGAIYIIPDMISRNNLIEINWAAPVLLELPTHVILPFL